MFGVWLSTQHDAVLVCIPHLFFKILWLEFDWTYGGNDASHHWVLAFSSVLQHLVHYLQCLWWWWWGGVFVSSSSACCVLPAELRPGGRWGWGGCRPLLNYGCRWRGDEGWPRGNIQPSIANTSDSTPTLPPSSPFPPATLSAQTVTIHAWREVGWGWLEMCLSFVLSLCFAIFLSLLLHFRPYLSLPLPHNFCWETPSNRGPFSRNWSADVEETRQRHTVSWFSSSVNYQQYSAAVKNASLGCCFIIAFVQIWEMFCED